MKNPNIILLIVLVVLVLGVGAIQLFWKQKAMINGEEIKIGRLGMRNSMTYETTEIETETETEEK